ncbi:hypothetical protein [Acerihabitans arboris]|uniref:Uncharacterized protein n=1 Tax=Acerihabitans arboris TaxID=2691583 RepID=A0A845SPZ1_9GAMM|nr:hypothetical protein [Acerihabitans arboris]NDL64661.1 hypothetical protein [Acerihabitans arboris]
MAKFLMIGGSLDGKILEKSYPRELIHKFNNSVSIECISSGEQLREINAIETYYVERTLIDGKFYAYASSRSLKENEADELIKSSALEALDNNA